MERMTVYRLMEWLSRLPACTEVRISVPQATDFNDILGMERDEDAGAVYLETGDVEITEDKP